MGRELTDDGPKLREERNFEEFHEDLRKDTRVPIVTLNNINNDTESRVHSHHVKQMIFNGKVTFEPVRLNQHNSDFKETKINVNQLSNQVLKPKGKGIHKSTNYNNKTRGFNELTTPYINKFIHQYNLNDLNRNIINAISGISKAQRNFLSEYDMDEQDELYLQFLNNRYCKGTLTNDLFEIVMTVLENEWIHLEKQIPPRSLSSNSSASDHHTQTARIYYELYGSDDGTSAFSEQACAVCNETESTNSNAIVFCDGCDVAVHQECYGIVFIPEGQWLCRLCLVSKNRKVNCALCPSHTGAFKQTDAGAWAHVICAIWIPELYFANLNYMEPIEGIQNIHKSRWKLNCYICDQKVGSCIQCSNKNCFTAYHVTCAKRASLCINFNKTPVSTIVQNQMSSDNMIQSYCDKHSPTGWHDCTEGIMKTRRYYRDLNQSKIENNIFPEVPQKNETQVASANRSKWKTNRGTPIAPHFFSQIVESVLSLAKVEHSNKVCYLICKYWSMKRELKRGAPLVRRFDSSSYNTLTLDQLKERINFSDVLLEDLLKLKGLSKLIKKRIELDEKLNSIDKNINNISRAPEKIFLRNAILSKFVSSPTFRAFERLFQESNKHYVMIVRCKNFEFNKLSEFKEYMEESFAQIEQDPDSTRLLLTKTSKTKELFESLINKISDFDVKKHIRQDFTSDPNNGMITQERPWKGPILLEDEELSDAEELNIREERLLRHFLNR
ncbi:hypothetical protein Kpol_520p19 [Vanderwaltozyma polyspora DSM 70294]|uniref:NuA3 HAT complex component NTO1 n=1 Tax=Vanderwaltozyma polyspora (strain ATCC 22028 / DSM 70294 / BCRC 21397 / CBS 2163 / NBRC 10782 / NRRL Y-8283 / UCD 57-17) TaxID=436907 RepID=A7TMA4_VANPO|nr:uncharacterized protein Kpol_520p19 [Vanderwaltozyma polyspora DSM 70294]EDO16598.1 hypothetical protein Kpol_520p19 [Vanderwaltozyma polyspora DSM 70294]